MFFGICQQWLYGFIHILPLTIHREIGHRNDLPPFPWTDYSWHSYFWVNLWNYHMSLTQKLFGHKRGWFPLTYDWPGLGRTTCRDLRSHPGPQVPQVSGVQHGKLWDRVFWLVQCAHGKSTWWGKIHHAINGKINLVGRFNWPSWKIWRVRQWVSDDIPLLWHGQ